MLKLQMAAKDNDMMEIFEPNPLNYFNDGTMQNVTEWPWENVQLPIMDFNTKTQFYSTFDTLNGGVNLDNVYFHTRQK